MTKEIEEMDKAVRCLALELPEQVWKEVNDRWHKCRDSLLASSSVQERAKELYPYPENDLYKEGDADLQEMIWIVDRERAAYLAGSSSIQGEVERLREQLERSDSFIADLCKELGVDELERWDEWKVKNKIPL
jgi:hypothetical protein